VLAYVLIGALPVALIWVSGLGLCVASKRGEEQLPIPATERRDPEDRANKNLIRCST